MDALDSPLEALALNYLTYGFLTAVNNIWAWVAVITAAVSLWRIRASSPLPVSTPELRSRCQESASTSSSPPQKVPEWTAAAEVEAIASAAHSETPFCDTLEREGGCTKTKFSLYFERDGESVDSGCAAAAVRSEKFDRRCDDWDRMGVVMRMGDMGWYRWQDMTVLDGSVVQLWDGSRRRHAAALVIDGGGGVW